jgi:hypothetical protein
MIFELGNCLPFHELMDALGVVYPWYWLGLDPETSFQLHLNVIKNVYCVKQMWSEGALDFAIFGPYYFRYAIIFICFDNEK